MNVTAWQTADDHRKPEVILTRESLMFPLTKFPNSTDGISRDIAPDVRRKIAARNRIYRDLHDLMASRLLTLLTPRNTILEIDNRRPALLWPRLANLPTLADRYVGYSAAVDLGRRAGMQQRYAVTFKHPFGAFDNTFRNAQNALAYLWALGVPERAIHSENLFGAALHYASNGLTDDNSPNARFKKDGAMSGMVADLRSNTEYE